MTATTATNARLAAYFTNLLSDPAQVAAFAGDLAGTPADMDDNGKRSRGAMMDSFGDVFEFIGHVSAVDQVAGEVWNGVTDGLSAVAAKMQRAPRGSVDVLQVRESRGPAGESFRQRSTRAPGQAGPVESWGGYHAARKAWEAGC